jgi:hypothetical protein
MRRWRRCAENRSAGRRRGVLLPFGRDGDGDEVGAADEDERVEDEDLPWRGVGVEEGEKAKVVESYAEAEEVKKKTERGEDPDEAVAEVCGSHPASAHHRANQPFFFFFCSAVDATASSPCSTLMLYHYAFPSPQHDISR